MLLTFFSVSSPLLFCMLIHKERFSFSEYFDVNAYVLVMNTTVEWQNHYQIEVFHREYRKKNSFHIQTTNWRHSPFCVHILSQFFFSLCRYMCVCLPHLKTLWWATFIEYTTQYFSHFLCNAFLYWQYSVMKYLWNEYTQNVIEFTKIKEKNKTHRTHRTCFIFHSSYSAISIIVLKFMKLFFFNVRSNEFRAQSNWIKYIKI